MATTMSTNVDNVYVDSVITISLETGIDLTALGTVYIDVKFPAGHNPAITRLTGTKNGTKITYKTTKDTLDVAGTYSLQAVLSAGAPDDDVPGDTCLLIVKARFK